MSVCTSAQPSSDWAVILVIAACSSEGDLTPLMPIPPVWVGDTTRLVRGKSSLDVVLTNLSPTRDGTNQWLLHRLDEQPVSLVGTPARLSDRTRSLTALLAEEPLVLPSRDTALRAGFDALASRLGVEPTIAAEADDMAMLRLMAREDLGLAVLPPIVVRDELAQGMLVEAARLEGISETFVAVTVARRFPNPLLSELLTR